MVHGEAALFESVDHKQSNLLVIFHDEYSHSIRVQAA